MTERDMIDQFNRMMNQRKWYQYSSASAFAMALRRRSHRTTVSFQSRSAASCSSVKKGASSRSFPSSSVGTLGGTNCRRGGRCRRRGWSILRETGTSGNGVGVVYGITTTCRDDGTPLTEGIVEEMGEEIKAGDASTESILRRGSDEGWNIVTILSGALRVRPRLGLFGTVWSEPSGDFEEV